MQKNVSATPPLPLRVRLRFPITFRMEMPPGRAAKRVVNPPEKRRKSGTNTVGGGPPGDRARARGRRSAAEQGDGAVAQGAKHCRVLCFFSSCRSIDRHLCVCVSMIEYMLYSTSVTVGCGRVVSMFFFVVPIQGDDVQPRAKTAGAARGGMVWFFIGRLTDCYDCYYR